MITPTKQLILSATLLAMVAGLTGCKTGTRTITDNDVFPYEGGKIDPYVKHTIVLPHGPSPTEGTLPVALGLFSDGNNGQSCFPSSAGWNKFYVTFYFLGPNVSPPPNPNNYPNTENLGSVTIDTLVLENGTNLDTGIVIVDNLNPAAKVCNDDTAVSFPTNPKLSLATFTPTGSGKKYRATIFYKSATASGLSEIKIHWKYP